MDNTHPLDFRPFPSQAGCFKCSNRSVQEQLWNCSFRRTLDPCSPWPNCSAPVRPLRSVCSRFVSSQWTVPSCENYALQLHRLRRREQKAHLRPLGHGSRQTGGVAFLTPLRLLPIDGQTGSFPHRRATSNLAFAISIARSSSRQMQCRERDRSPLSPHPRRQDGADLRIRGRLLTS